MQEGFRILEHPADIGIEARGGSLKDVFEFAALGLVSILVNPATIDPVEQRVVNIKASDLQNLLVKWLSEVLYLYDGEDFLVADVSIERLSPTGLEAILTGEPVDERKHEFRMDVKAITYHNLKIVEGADHCSLQVFLDI